MMMQDEEEEVGEHQSPFQQLPAQSQDTEECSTVHLSISRERHTSMRLNALFWKNEVCTHRLALLH